MSMQLKVDSWDYKEAIKKVNKLLDDAMNNGEGIETISGTEIVDLVIDTII